MGTNRESLSSCLFGATRRAVLALLYLRPRQSFYLRQIGRLTRSGQGAVQRELARLTGSGLILRARRGKEVYYQANPACPVFKELASLMAKTAGLAEVLQEALSPLAHRIRAAFVFGSFAAGGQREESDVDVMVIGDASFAEVCEALRPAQERLGRELNPTVYPVKEFRGKLAGRHHFVSGVMRGEKIFLIGTEHELEELAGKRLEVRMRKKHPTLLPKGAK